MPNWIDCCNNQTLLIGAATTHCLCEILHERYQVVTYVTGMLIDMR